MVRCLASPSWPRLSSGWGLRACHGGGRTTSGPCSAARVSPPRGAASRATGRPASAPTPTARAGSAASLVRARRRDEYAKSADEIREWILDGQPRRLRDEQADEPPPALRMPAWRGRFSDPRSTGSSRTSRPCRTSTRCRTTRRRAARRRRASAVSRVTGPRGAPNAEPRVAERLRPVVERDGLPRARTGRRARSASGSGTARRVGSGSTPSRRSSCAGRRSGCQPTATRDGRRDRADPRLHPLAAAAGRASTAPPGPTPRRV